MTELHSSLLGCWENLRFANEVNNQKAQKLLIGSYMVCFRKDGRVTGVTFDDGDGWEWSDSYHVDKDIIYFNSKIWGQVLNITAKNITAELNGKRMEFKFLCRTKQEDIQCERLEYQLDP